MESTNSIRNKFFEGEQVTYSTTEKRVKFAGCLWHIYRTGCVVEIDEITFQPMAPDMHWTNKTAVAVRQEAQKRGWTV